MNEKIKNQRKNYLIDKKFQFKYISVILIITLITIIYTACVVSSAFLISLNEGLSFVEILLKHLGWIILLLIFNIVIVAIYFSHKIAGPLYRFERVLEQVSQGNLTVQAKIRKRDSLKSLEKSLNLTIETLNILVKEDEEVIKKVSEIIKELKSDLSMNKDLSQEKITHLIEKLSHMDDKIKKIIHPFKTKKEGN